MWLSKFLSICYSWLLWNALISQSLSQAFPPRLSVLCCMSQSQSFVPGYWVFFVHLTTFSRNVFCISSMDVFWLRWNKDHRQYRTDIKKYLLFPPPQQGPEPNTEHRLPSSRPPLIWEGVEKRHVKMSQNFLPFQSCLFLHSTYAWFFAISVEGWAHGAANSAIFPTIHLLLFFFFS